MSPFDVSRLGADLDLLIITDIGADTEAIPLPNVSSSVLKKVRSYI